MTDTTVAEGLRVQQWDSKFFREYVQANRFAKYMGTDENSLIQVKKDLKKKKGDSITFALVNRLQGGGVTGSGTLEGNEEDLDTRSHRLFVDKLRNGVRVSEMEEQKSALGLRNAGKATLKTWIMEKTRDNIIDALGSIHTGSAQVLYGSASEAQKDAWLVDNADRVIFGDALGNGGYTDHSADLATVTAAMTLTPDLIELAKRVALTADPKIKPIMTKGDEQWYVMFAHPYQMRDLKSDSEFRQTNRDARERSKSNPLFTDSDYLWDGVIIREIADMNILTGVGASSANLAPAFLCGAQAVGIGWAKTTTSKEEEFDYGDKHGVAIEEIRGIEKLHFGSGSTDTADVKQNGVVTVYTSAIADS